MKKINAKNPISESGGSDIAYRRLQASTNGRKDW